MIRDLRRTVSAAGEALGGAKIDDTTSHDRLAHDQQHALPSRYGKVL